MRFPYPYQLSPQYAENIVARTAQSVTRRTGQSGLRSVAAKGRLRVNLVRLSRSSEMPIEFSCSNWDSQEKPRISNNGTMGATERPRIL